VPDNELPKICDIDTYNTLLACNDGLGNAMIEVNGALNMLLVIMAVSLMTQKPTQAGVRASRC